MEELGVSSAGMEEVVAIVEDPDSADSLILGQKELIDGTIIIRDMESGTQEVIDYKKIYSELNKRLEESKEKNKEISA